MGTVVDLGPCNPCNVISSEFSPRGDLYILRKTITITITPGATQHQPTQQQQKVDNAGINTADFYVFLPGRGVFFAKKYPLVVNSTLLCPFWQNLGGGAENSRGGGRTQRILR